MMSTLLKLGISGYDVKPRLVRANANISYKIHFFFGKNFGDTRHPYEKSKPTLDHSGGGGCTVRPTGS